MYEGIPALPRGADVEAFSFFGWLHPQLAGAAAASGCCCGVLASTGDDAGSGVKLSALFMLSKYDGNPAPVEGCL